MFLNKEYNRKWFVDVSKIPNLSFKEYIEHSIIFLNSNNDTVQVSINKQKDKNGSLYYMSMLDLNNNKISYLISENDFNDTVKLIGNVLIKKIYIIKSNIDNTDINLEVYQNVDLITANFYSNDEKLLQIKHTEDWFLGEINDLSFNDNELFLKTKKS